MQKKKKSQKLNPKASLVVPDLTAFSKLTEDFLQKEEQRAKNFARWELNYLWTKYREIKVFELKSLDIKSLPVADAIVVKHLRYILNTEASDLSELNKLYDRLLGKPKETREEKLIDDVEFTIGILKNPNEPENNPIEIEADK